MTGDNPNLKELVISIRGKKREFNEKYWLSGTTWALCRTQAKHIVRARAGLLGRDALVPYAYISQPGKTTSAECVQATPLPGGIGVKYLTADGWSAQSVKCNTLSSGLFFRMESEEGVTLGKRRVNRLFRGIPDAIVGSDQYLLSNPIDSPTITIAPTAPTLDDTTIVPIKLWPDDLVDTTPAMTGMVKWQDMLDKFLSLIFHFTVFATPDAVSTSEDYQTYQSLNWREFMYRGIRDNVPGRPSLL
jgi:hypothetical protein